MITMPSKTTHHEMRPLRPLIAGLTTCLAAALLAGCGGSSKQQSTPAVPSGQRGILATVDQLQTASRAGDGKRICSELFTPRLVASVEASAGRSCAKEVRAHVFSPNEDIAVGRDIRVTGTRATATIREQNGNLSKLFMVKQNGRWRIDRVQPQRKG
jgi:hypothetical protein